MALTKDQKKAQVTELKDALEKSKSLIFMHYCGLSVSQADDLRGKMQEKNAKMKVIKKTLYRIAAKENGLPEVPDKVLDGPVALVFSFEDEISGAKVAYEFGKSNDAVELIGGVLNDKVLTKSEAMDLAKILSHDKMLAKFAAMMCTPLTSFASMCGSPLSSFTRVVKEFAEKNNSKDSVTTSES